MQTMGPHMHHERVDFTRSVRQQKGIKLPVVAVPPDKVSEA